MRKLSILRIYVFFIDIDNVSILMVDVLVNVLERAILLEPQQSWDVLFIGILGGITHVVAVSLNSTSHSSQQRHFYPIFFHNILQVSNRDLFSDWYFLCLFLFLLFHWVVSFFFYILAVCLETYGWHMVNDLSSFVFYRFRVDLIGKDIVMVQVNI